ncbi:glycosyltransferase family 39 protein [Streptomyces sp. I05A-00742]|uniref:glycosyltransferase family 39 protein n=1 Tax=Streptomyces sp. I05A-00742 TaxID=2732853 RepID=UPI001489C06C|nr:glycosyltransferase family 39 protein [Streptomyces sp. I05A-00742]
MTATSPQPATSGTSATPVTPGASAGRDRLLRAAGWVSPAVGLGLGIWGNREPSAWTDEIVTIDVARRSWPQMFELLGQVDAVHGLHYVLMHLVGQAFGGLNEYTARVPSAVAVAVAVAGLTWLGRLLGGPRLGLCAGLLLAVLPTAARYAQEARSFAFVMAVAVLATGTLVKVLSSRTRGRWLVAHAVLIALLGWFNVLGLLLVAAHAVTVALLRPGRRVTIHLLAAQAAGIAAVVPLLILGSRQSSAVGEAAPVTAGTPLNYFTWLLTPGQDTLPTAPKLLLILTALAALALLVMRRHRAPSLALAVGVPWLAVPPLLLMAVSLGHPLFAYRYLLFCLPALALLLATAFTVVPSPLRLLLVVLPAVPLVASHLAIRQPDSRPWDTHAVIWSLSTRDAPGDAVLFSGARCGLIANAFELAFTNRPDVGRTRTAAEAGALDNLPADPDLLRQRLAHTRRVWHITCTHLSGDARQAATRTAAAQKEALARAGFSPIHHHKARGMDITIEQRPAD